MIEKNKRWVDKRYTDWVATLPCVNCGLHNETIVAHHLKHRHAPHGGGGMGLKANDFFTMPLCFECHASAHSGDANILDWQADFIFKTLNSVSKTGKTVYIDHPDLQNALQIVSRKVFVVNEGCYAV